MSGFFFSPPHLDRGVVHSHDAELVPDHGALLAHDPRAVLLEPLGRLRHLPRLHEQPEGRQSLPRTLGIRHLRDLDLAGHGQVLVLVRKKSFIFL